MKRNQKKYLFLGLAFLSLLTLSTLTLFIDMKTHMLLSVSILFMLTFEVIQLIRIFKRGIVYKKWMNHEFSYSTFIFILFLSVPNLLRFSLSTRPWKYFAIFSLTCIIIILFGLVSKIIIYRNSFYNSDGITIPEIINVLDKKDIVYNIKQVDKRFNFIAKQKDKEIHLPKYGCMIFKTNERIIIKPDNRKDIKNVYNIINILEE